MKSYYCDYNATTPVADVVIEKMLPFLKEHWGNPSSVHHLARIPARAVREARVKVARLIGATRDSEIIFTSCGSESNNAAILSGLAANPAKKEIITSKVEHSATLKFCRQLAKEGYIVHEIGVSQQGFLNFDELRSKLSDKTAIVTMMLANNETGVLFPVDEIGQMCREVGALFHVDGVQAAGKYALDVKQSPIDYLSLSAHKLYGPKGVGALYVREEVPFKNLITGGGQERGRRAGTENVASIVGFGAACDLAMSDLEEEIKRLTEVRNHFEETILRENIGVSVNGDRQRRLPTTSNLQFAGIDGEAFMMALDQRGVCCSAGSACMSGSTEPSHVLKAMAFSDDEANSSIRFSFGRFTKGEDIPEITKIIKDTITFFKTGNTPLPNKAAL